MCHCWHGGEGEAHALDELAEEQDPGEVEVLHKGAGNGEGAEAHHGEDARGGEDLASVRFPEQIVLFLV